MSNNIDNDITKGLKRKENIRTRNKFPFEIEKCNKQIYQQSFVQQFIRKLETENIDLINSKENNQNPEQQIVKVDAEEYKCGVCDKTCKNLAGLKAHERFKHTYQHVTIRRK